MPLLSRLQILTLAILLVITTNGITSLSVDTSNDNSSLSIDEPYNVILMIGDGMGPSQIELGNLVENGLTANFPMQQASLFLTVTTYSADKNITDSAAAATAIATGQKTNNGMLSVLPNGTVLETILEIAKLNGKATGLVATSYIQHATPAAFVSHVSSRSNIAEITRQIVEESEVDILLGGGMSYFSSSQLQAMENRNYTIVQNRTELLSVQSGKILGLFADGNMDYEEVRVFADIPSLAEMTNKTLDILSQDSDGFFLMVEGSRIDHAGHNNNPVGVALETIAFNDAVEVALKYIQAHRSTILIVTADHETGGLAVVSHNLSDELPTDEMTEEERRTLRIARAENISVTWSTGYHTDVNIPLFCFGPLFDGLANQSVIDNTAIFDELSAYYIAEPDNSVSDPTETTTTTTDSTTSTEITTTETTGSTTRVSSTSESSTSTTDGGPVLNLDIPLFFGITLGFSIAVIAILMIWRRYIPRSSNA